jgi:hypothetical protein
MKTTQILLGKLLILVTMSSLSAQDDSVPAAGLQEPDSGLRSDVPDALSAKQAEINRPPAIDKSRLAGCDLHTIGIYGQEASGDDRVYVTVKNTGRPMVIVLCSYMETQWNVTIEPGAEVRQLIASGWFEQEITAPKEIKEIPVHIVVGSSSRDAKHFWAYSWHTKEGRDVRKRVRELTDLEIATFQGFYNGSRHVIDGKSGLVSELDKQRTPDEEAALKKQSGATDDRPQMMAGDHPAPSSIAELQRKKADAEAIWRTAETLTLEEAKRIRNETATASPETLKNLKDQLAKSVRNSFDRQLELQEIRMQLAAAELSSLQQKQASRKKTADVIIERRVEDLLTGADLSWPQASHSNGANSSNRNSVDASVPTKIKAALRCDTPEELLETLRQLPENGDPATIVTYFTDNAVEEFAGTLLMTATMFSSVVPVMAAQADADPKSTQMMLQIVEIMGRSMKKDATKEARDAYQRMSSRTNVMMAAFRKGPAYTDVDEFEADLRNSVGMLRDPRAFVVEVFNAMQSESDSNDASPLRSLQPDQKTTWTLNYSDNGQMATAIPDGVSSQGEQGSTLQLSRTEHGWRIHKLFDKATLAKLATGPTVSSDSLDSSDSDDSPAGIN